MFLLQFSNRTGTRAEYHQLFLASLTYLWNTSSIKDWDTFRKVSALKVYAQIRSYQLPTKTSLPEKMSHVCLFPSHSALRTCRHAKFMYQNRATYSGSVSTVTANLPLITSFLISVISTPRTKIQYLITQMDQHKLLYVAFTTIPSKIIAPHKLKFLAHNG
jgi:hypothetical protein